MDTAPDRVVRLDEFDVARRASDRNGVLQRDELERALGAFGQVEALRFGEIELSHGNEREIVPVNVCHRSPPIWCAAWSGFV